MDILVFAHVDCGLARLWCRAAKDALHITRVGALSIVLSGCPLVSQLSVPTTYLLASTSDEVGRVSDPADVPIDLWESSDGIVWKRVQSPTDGPGNTARARAQVAPAIANDTKRYAMAWWSELQFPPPPRFYRSRTLYVSIHDPAIGSGWTTPRELISVADGDVDELSRPSLAWLPITDQWVVAYRDTSYGLQVSKPFSLNSITYQNSWNTINVSADLAPALAHLDSNHLLIALHVPPSGGVAAGYTIRTLTSTDGEHWTPTVGAVAVEPAAGRPAGGAQCAAGSQACVLDAGPFQPFLSNGPEGVLLAVARTHIPPPASQNDIVVFASGDGVNWTRTAVRENIGGNAGVYTPAVAGTSTNMVFAYPDYPRSGKTAVFMGAHAAYLDTRAAHGVAITFGPKPSLPSVP